MNINILTSQQLYIYKFKYKIYVTINLCIQNKVFKYLKFKYNHEKKHNIFI